MNKQETDIERFFIRLQCNLVRLDEFKNSVIIWLLKCHQLLLKLSLKPSLKPIKNSIGIQLQRSNNLSLTFKLLYNFPSGWIFFTRYSREGIQPEFVRFGSSHYSLPNHRFAQLNSRLVNIFWGDEVKCDKFYVLRVGERLKAVSWFYNLIDHWTFKAPLITHRLTVSRITQ